MTRKDISQYPMTLLTPFLYRLEDSRNLDRNGMEYNKTGLWNWICDYDSMILWLYSSSPSSNPYCPAVHFHCISCIPSSTYMTTQWAGSVLQQKSKLIIYFCWTSFPLYSDWCVQLLALKLERKKENEQKHPSQAQIQ